MKEDTRIEGPWEYGTFITRGGDHKSLKFKDLRNATKEDILEMTPY